MRHEKSENSDKIGVLTDKFKTDHPCTLKLLHVYFSPLSFHLFKKKISLKF